MSTVGQAVGGIVGGVVGFFVGGPTGALYGAQIGMMAGGYLDPPKGPVLKGPRLSDLSVQTSTYGAPLPRIYGQVGTFGNIFWLENNKIKEVVRKSSQGGKGGGPTTTVKNYEYYATFAVGLADTTKTGPIAGVKRIWVGGRLIYNAGSSDRETIAASNSASALFRVYTGSETQMPDPRMQADLGIDNCPAHRGVAYIVFYDYPLKEHGNSLLGAQVKVEVINSTEAELTIDSIDMFHRGHSATAGDAVLIATGSYNAVTGLSRISFCNRYTWSVVNVDMPLTVGAIFYDQSRRYFIVYAAAGSRVYSADTGQFLGTIPGSVFPAYKAGNGLIISGSSQISVWAYGLGAAEKLYDGPTLNTSFENPSINQDRPKTYYVGSDIAYFTQLRVFLVNSTSTTVHFVHPSPPSGFNITGMVTDGSEVIVSCQETGRNDYVARIVAGNLVEMFEIPNISFITDYDPNTDTIITSHQVYSRDGELKFTFANISFPGFFTIMVDGQVLVPTPTLGPMTTYAQYISSGDEDLQTIIENECLQSNILTAGDIDASLIEQPVRGYRVSDTGAIRAALEPLQGAWPFDVVQRGYKIVFVPRGNTSVVTIPASNLDARQESDAPGTQLAISNEMDTQLPRRVQIRYMDAVREYDIAEQANEKTATESINIRDIELPIVLDADEAAGMAEVLLHLYWLERRDVSFRLPPEYRGLEPADVITITGEWGVYQLRLVNVNLLSDGRLECAAKYNSAAIYTPVAKGEEGSAIPPGTVPVGGPSLFALLDIPLLADENNMPGWPGAMTGYTEGWPGGLIYRSTDNGQTWTAIQAFSSPVTMGFAKGTIGSGRVDIFDNTSRLFVDLLAGEMSSISELSQLNGGNLIAYGAPGRWEICSPRNVEEQSDGSYLMYDWLRGRFGSEWAMTLHQAGDSIVLLTDPDVVFVSMPSASIGAEYQYRGITAGQSIDSDLSRALTYTAVNLKPLSGVYPRASKSPANDWTINWIRRGRLSPEWRNLVDVPVGESTEAYEIDIFSSSAFTTLKRTLTSTTPQVVYTSAQQVTDFGSVQSVLYVKIYQMSETVGRGYALTATL